MGTLYLVATPIGNLEDVTVRALSVLRSAALVLCEDTRTTKRLFDRYGITRPRVSYTEHNHAERLPAVLQALAGGDVALVSEAGMPGINDPGQALVAAAASEGHTVSAIPGASAVPLAVALAGFPVATFIYLGFLPHRPGDRRRILRENAGSGHALVFFETPHRLREALADLLETLGDRRLAVCRELTKLHEEVFRGTVSGAIAHFAEPRGEFTLVVHGGLPGEEGEAGLEPFLADLAARGSSARDAVAAATARFGVSRRIAYDAWQSLRAVRKEERE